MVRATGTAPPIRRGAVWWADLPDARGSGPGFRRPVVVISSDAFNASQIQTVVVVVLTSNLRLADAPGNVRVPARGAGLPRESVANVSQVLTVDKDDLVERAGQLRPALLEELAAGLRLVLEL
jgi:mRNA interferase MazF